MRKTKGFDIRKISKLSTGMGVFLTKEVKELKWDTETFVSVRADKENDSIVLKRVKI